MSITTPDSAPALVIGATGKQGSATARALLAVGVPVRALVRDRGTERAKAIEALGAELVVGDLRNRDSVITGFDFDGEVAPGVNLIDSAKARRNLRVSPPAADER